MTARNPRDSPVSPEETQRLFLEHVRWSLAATLGPDFDHTVGLGPGPAGAAWFVARVEAAYAARELVDEREVVQVPATDWDRTKDGLNGLLGTLDGWLGRRGLAPLGFRFGVRRRPLVLTRVYHACPHGRGERSDCGTWLAVGGDPDDRVDFRAAHRIRGVIADAALDPDSAMYTLNTIDRLLHDTGVFGRRHRPTRGVHP